MNIKNIICITNIILQLIIFIININYIIYLFKIIFYKGAAFQNISINVMDAGGLIFIIESMIYACIIFCASYIINLIKKNLIYIIEKNE